MEDEIKAGRFFENLKLILTALNWKYTDLAKALHMSRQNVCNYVRGVCKPNLVSYYAFRYVIEREISQNPEAYKKAKFILSTLVDDNNCKGE